MHSGNEIKPVSTHSPTGVVLLLRRVTEEVIGLDFLRLLPPALAVIFSSLLLPFWDEHTLARGGGSLVWVLAAK